MKEALQLLLLIFSSYYHCHILFFIVIAKIRLSIGICKFFREKLSHETTFCAFVAEFMDYIRVFYGSFLLMFTDLYRFV